MDFSKLIFDFNVNEVWIISCSGIEGLVDETSRGAFLSTGSLKSFSRSAKCGFTLASASSAWCSFAFRMWLRTSSKTASVTMRATENRDQNSCSSNSEVAFCQISAEWQICSRNKCYTSAISCMRILSVPIISHLTPNTYFDLI